RSRSRPLLAELLGQAPPAVPATGWHAASSQDGGPAHKSRRPHPVGHWSATIGNAVSTGWLCSATDTTTIHFLGPRAPMGWRLPNAHTIGGPTDGLWRHSPARRDSRAGCQEPRHQGDGGGPVG